MTCRLDAAEASAGSAVPDDAASGPLQWDDARDWPALVEGAPAGKITLVIIIEMEKLSTDIQA